MASATTRCSSVELSMLLKLQFKMGRKNTDAPQWPKIKKGKELNITRMYGDQIITVENCLSEQEAQRFIEVAESIGLKHQSSRGALFGEAFRDNDRLQFESAELAQDIWNSSGIRQAMADIPLDGETACCLNSNIRLYRYSRGQRFGRHVDDANETTQGWTQYTLLVYLSTCKGGETIFYDDRGRKIAVVQPQPGLALLHRHGDYCLEHEGAKVEDGVKYVLRSDVVYA